MARDAFYFLIPILLLALLAFWMGWTLFWICLIVLAAFVAFFFRDPERKIPDEPMAILSPADGKVVQVKQTDRGLRLSIFLSVFNVHINRAPIAGEIRQVDYRPGRFLLAFDERASVENEQVMFRIRGAEQEVSFSLIAGLVARRIIPWKMVGEQVGRGERIALIRFGSRADIWIPSGYDICVGEGDRVLGGTTVLAVPGRQR